MYRPYPEASLSSLPWGMAALIGQLYGRKRLCVCSKPHIPANLRVSSATTISWDLLLSRGTPLYWKPHVDALSHAPMCRGRTSAEESFRSQKSGTAGTQETSAARPGAQSRDALTMAEKLTPEDHVVLIEIGGNDLLEGVPSVEFGKALDTLLSRASAPGRMVVMFRAAAVPAQDRAYRSKFSEIWQQDMECG
jgi:acyl-CoA thioesterase I